MYFHIILTEKCNSKCKYCYEKSLKEFDNSLNSKFEFDFNSPADSKVNSKKLKKFLKKDPYPKIIFYGGEPLIAQEKIIEIIDNISELPNIEFFMQTNGKLLNKLPKKYLLKFKKILISIDGNKKRTDFNRGTGTYDKVIENLKLIKQKSFTGEIVARITISPSINPKSYDLLEQIKHLQELNLFDSYHWQLDMNFYESDYNYEIIKEFVQNYNIEISKLVLYWIKQIKKGNVIKLYPFLGIFESLYYNKPTKLRCGSGHTNYTITTDGKITCCPIMNNIKNFYIGDIKNNLPLELKKIYVISPCDKCQYLDICGGRCLYANYAKLWPKKGQELICNTIIHLINEIKKIIPEIKQSIKKDLISEEQFFYEKYFGPEIIP